MQKDSPYIQFDSKSFGHGSNLKKKKHQQKEATRKSVPGHRRTKCVRALPRYAPTTWPIGKRTALYTRMTCRKDRSERQV